MTQPKKSEYIIRIRFQAGINDYRYQYISKLKEWTEDIFHAKIFKSVSAAKTSIRAYDKRKNTLYFDSVEIAPIC
jgi:hypothetical protein